MSQPLPEVHIIGEILNGKKFSSSNAFAKFDIESGDSWDCAGGDQSGQTQVDYRKMVCPANLSTASSFWIIELLLVFVVIRFLLMQYAVFGPVGNLDEYGAKQVFGYGVCHLPTSAGIHEIECPIWRVVGTTLQEAYAFFLDIKPQLRETKLISQTAQEDRSKICTVSVGSIKMRISVLLRNFGKFDLEWE